ncbi:MAG: heavy metal translocating P-type ATPase [Sarcina sp.]
MGDVKNKLNHNHENCNCGSKHSEVPHKEVKEINNVDSCNCGHNHGTNSDSIIEGTNESSGEKKSEEKSSDDGDSDPDSCSCGHDHKKEDDHEEKHEHENCGCGHDHEEEHKHEDCGCGHDHGEKHEHESCDCGHDHATKENKIIESSGKNQFKLKLEGLDCAGCAAKIEDRTNNLEEINDANLNFTTKTLVVDLNDSSNKNKAMDDIKAIVKKLEPDVVVKEIKASAKKNSNKLKLALEGLDCAGCAAKIEDRANNLEDVNEAVLNFASKYIVLELKDKNDIDKVEVEVKAIIKKLEPDVEVHRVSDKKEYKEIKDTDQKKKVRFDEVPRNKMIKFIIAIVIYALGQWGGFAETIRIGLFVVAYLLLAYPVLTKAVKNISKGEVFDENFLMSIATIGAFLTGEHPEAVAVMLFYEIGEMFQGYALNKSRNSITALMDIKPDYARIEENNIEKKVSPESVEIGDTIIVRAGERIPLDGVVISGDGSVDTSALTGESMPREIKVGEEVLGGCINLSGVIKLRVTTEFSESTLSKILELVENAGTKKAKTEKFITKFSKYYTPVVVFTAIALVVIPPLVIPGATFTEWLQRALIFLVVSCPCALVVSIPLGFFGGIGLASKEGILVKGGNYLEALNSVKTVIFDKTGTLTEGKFNILKIESGNLEKEKFLEIAAYSEYYSNHPIAESIKKAYKGEIDKTTIENYSEIAGKGITLTLRGQNVLAGNAKMMRENNIEFKEVNEIGTAIHIAVNENYLGYVLIGDKIKETSKETIAELKKNGIKTIMLTGDNKVVAEAIGKELGIDKVCSELLPQNKVEELEKAMKGLNEKDHTVFVGDGINDAPVLARADIGIAMGGVGSDAAIEAADVVIMNDEPERIIKAISIAKKTRTIVWQNIIFALAVKAVILVLGALGYATMWEAVFGDVGVAIIAIINSMRILINSNKNTK